MYLLMTEAYKRDRIRAENLYKARNMMCKMKQQVELNKRQDRFDYYRVISFPVLVSKIA